MTDSKLFLGAQAHECRFADTREAHHGDENVIGPVSRVS